MKQSEYIDNKLKEIENLQRKWEDLANPKNKFIKFFNWTFRFNELKKIHGQAHNKLLDITSGKVLKDSMTP